MSTAGIRAASVDLAIVGSGAAGLAAAVRARSVGLSTLVVEKLAQLGGTASQSGGAIWIPNNRMMREAGAFDSDENALAYLDACVGDPGLPSSPARKRAYVSQGPRLIEFLRAEGLRFVYSDQYPDYYPELPGGHERGRSLMAASFDRRRLGAWDRRLRTVPRFALRLPYRDTREMMHIPYLRTTADGRRAAARLVGRTLVSRARGRREVSLGQALVSRLLFAACRSGVEFRTHAPLTELLTERGRVTGIVTEVDGHAVAVRSRHGVLLAAGGFAGNERMRREFGPQPSSVDWSLIRTGDHGDAIRLAGGLGAGFALMDEATWSPTSILPDGSVTAPLWERAAPHSMMVDAKGQRFCNEAASYMEVGQQMYAQGAVPCWLVFDHRHRRRYPFGDALPGLTPRSWLRSGYLKRSDTLAGLAAACGIDPEGLRRSVERFNRHADLGVDQDFGRGRSAFDRMEGDPGHGPNPCLGALREPPFYAVTHYPGDAGTCGGLLTDERARVLRPDGSAIPGLYAAGATTASVMGRVYPGPGCSLGPAMVFGYIAANEVAAAAGVAAASTASR